MIALLITLLKKRKKQQHPGNIVGSDYFDQDRNAPAYACHKQPPRSAYIQVAQQSRGSKRGEEQVVPGRHGRWIIRKTPGDDHQCDQAGRDRGCKTQRNIVDGRNPCQEKQEHAYPQRQQTYAKNAKSQRMDHAQATRVDLREIAMRKLPLHHSQRTLAQNSVVGRHPTTANTDADINCRDRKDCTQHHQVNTRALGSGHYRHFTLTDRQCLRTLFPNPYFYAQHSWARGRVNLQP